MKIIKSASGKKQVKISKKEWESIGKKAGWVKTANGPSWATKEDDLFECTYCGEESSGCEISQPPDPSEPWNYSCPKCYKKNTLREKHNNENI